MNKVDLIYKELSYDVVGCFYNVYNELGQGYKEALYANALAMEFEDKGIAYEREKKLR